MFSVRALVSVRSIALLSLTCVLAACASSSESSGPAADPVGTVTSAIRIQGQGAFLIDFDPGAVTSINSGGASDLYLDANVNFIVGPQVPVGQQPRRIASLGAVSGLGAVTTVPTAGLVVSLGAIAGHGYVVTDNGRNWRVYVTSLITSATSGGVIGVNIKWAAL